VNDPTFKMEFAGSNCVNCINSNHISLWLFPPTLIFLSLSSVSASFPLPPHSLPLSYFYFLILILFYQHISLCVSLMYDIYFHLINEIFISNIQKTVSVFFCNLKWWGSPFQESLTLATISYFNQSISVFKFFFFWSHKFAYFLYIVYP